MDGTPYTSECGNDRTWFYDGSRLPEWEGQQIERHWTVESG
jgi:hypothetical protein